MQCRMGLRLVTSLGVLLALWATSAQAGLIGLTLEGQYFVDSFSAATFSPTPPGGITAGSNTTADLGSGVSVTALFVSDTEIDFTLSNFQLFPGTFNGPIFVTTVGTTFGLTAPVVENTSLVGFTASDVTIVNGTTMSFNFAGAIHTNAEGRDVADITFTSTSPPSAVPEPSTASLLGAVVLVLTALTLRKSRRHLRAARYQSVVR